ncbi:MAG: hypothetical protein AAGN66_27710 [Acidobacteriota bacterium]
MQALPFAENTFVDFPGREALFHRLRAIEVYDTSMRDMFELVADRLAGKAYDRSAFVFILLELIYELDQDAVSFGDLLGRMVFALTGDLDLVGEALDAFEEIRETLEPEVGGGHPPAAPADWDPSSDHERMMLELQSGQKRVLDLGLTTRASIEQALARPTRQHVGQTLREISSLRSSLLHFEELLRGAEERILEAIGVLDKD